MNSLLDLFFDDESDESDDDFEMAAVLIAEMEEMERNKQPKRGGSVQGVRWFIGTSSKAMISYLRITLQITLCLVRSLSGDGSGCLRRYFCESQPL